MSDARFYAYAVPSWELLDGDLPLSGVTITEGISTPLELTATLDRQYAHLTTESGRRLIWEWGTAIVSEEAGRIMVFIVDGVVQEPEQETLSITAGGVGGYPAEQPWLPANDQTRAALDAMHAKVGTRRLESGAEAGGIGWVRKTGEIAGVEVDPLDIVRAIWTMLTTHRSADLRVTVDETTSQVRIGEEERDVNFTTSEGEEVEFTAGPYRLSWHGTDNLGREIDDLAEETPFEWWEESTWQGGLPSTRIRLAYPHMGRTIKDNLLFETGVNVVAVNGVGWSEYANVILVVGRGEGSARVRSHMSKSSPRLRRVHVESDASIGSRARAQERARKVLDDLTDRPVVESITVVDHPAARFGTFGLGDIITVRGSTGWAELGQQYRILTLSRDLDAGEIEMSLEEVRDA